ncbi:uncharacterized protein BO87DRAFT_349426 [Aspergillus neoniger CBS 115656]|uniref:Mediator of RNA polymerase II transcription subunit 19 n=1 Tax=Aspergillus neoniger (strain CBS 115656) TaxID=1448310 RepID=A0A318ZGH0_ASPNB|nr:Rox3-domain-containing protein [Aspergillus neoniger CBS 115656]PYH39368.1 Rox3-domain-containing protein [Aspergillus neoniger CBS 115656]
MSDRASSASFRVGPPSPSSPAAGALKQNQLPAPLSDRIPQTPTSPPLMSVSAQNYATNFVSSQASPNQATSQSATLSSPPSSAPMSTQASQQPTVGTANSFPTPASSVSGHFPGATSFDDSEHTDKPMGSAVPDTGAQAANMNAAAIQQAEHRRTDHDRHTEGINMEVGVRDFAANNGGDAMDIDSEAPTSSSEKINRLRKSYEGKLKGLGLAGRNKPVKNEPGVPGSLRHMTMWPEEEWQNQKVFGKEIKVADMDSALQNLQMRAMKMEPGTVPNNEYWEDVLGHEKPSKHAGGDASKKGVAPPPNGVRISQPNGTPAPVSDQERARPSRGRKRHYDDNSFVGYGEGYADDDDDGAFYSNSEGMGKKKRKKDHVSKISTPLPDRGGSYGVDPTKVSNTNIPYELHYAEKMTSYLYKHTPDPSPTLQLAIRAQHLKRWEVPRSTYPDGKVGYYSWRTAVARRQAEIAVQVCLESGIEEADAERVGRLIRKEGLKGGEDAEAQILEDVACLVFLDDQFEKFKENYERKKVVEILKKTWGKMSERGRGLALELQMGDEANELVKEALMG